MRKDIKIVHRRIKEAREKKGLNQARLAEQAGITPAAISQIEKGERIPTTPVLRRIADVLQISLDYLTGRTNESKLEDLLQNEDIRTFYRSFQELRQNDKDMIMKNVNFLLSESKQKKKK